MTVQKPGNVFLGSGRHYNAGCTKVLILRNGTTDGTIVCGAGVRHFEKGFTDRSPMLQRMAKLEANTTMVPDFGCMHTVKNFVNTVPT